MKNRGSEWRKWDLHVHSPYSILVGNGNYKGVTDEDFINKLKEEGISAIGLTNYFKFCDEDFELADKLRREGITTFMNLELRLTNTNDAQMLSDYHIIFSDQLSKDLIKIFLSNLDVYLGSSKIKAENLKKEEITTNAAVSFEGLNETLENESLKLKGKYLKAFLSRGHGNAVSGKNRGYTVYEEIVRNSDIVMHSSTFIENLEKDKEYFLGEEENSCKYVRPVLQSSDAHSLKDIGISVRKIDDKKENITKKGVYRKDDDYFINVSAFTWIKSDLTFEGLRQIKYEPDERIHYGLTKPHLKMNYLLIDKIEYYPNKYVFFNDELNVIIGGRSTGKSTLINSIAESQNNKNLEKDNHNTLPKEYKIYWRDGIINSDREVEYIPQEYMIDVAHDKGKFDSLIREIITKKGLNDREKEYLQNVNKIKINLANKLDEYFILRNEKNLLIKPEGDEHAIGTLICEMKNKVSKIRIDDQFTEEDELAYGELIKEKDLVYEQLNLIEIEKKKLEDLKSIKFLADIDLNQFRDDYKLELEETLRKIRINSEKVWREKLENLNATIVLEETKLNKTIRSIDSSTLYEKGNLLKDKNEEISILERNIKEGKENLIKIQKYSDQRVQIDKKCSEIESQIAEGYCDYLEEIINFKEAFKIDENEIEIKLKIHIDDFAERIDFLNARSVENNKFIEKFNEIMGSFDKERSKQFLETVFNKTDLIFNQQKNMEDLVRTIFSTNIYLFNYIVTFQNDEFSSMSQGKKSFVILKLLLEFSDDKKPVLIDQPEDSLDNRAIFHELKEYLLQTKKERQVILVTHNPNIVVGADAENIIVANQHSELQKNEDNQKFQYINGSMENTKKFCKSDYILESQGIREHIFDILEGGSEAFEKREQKYNYKN